MQYLDFKLRNIKSYNDLPSRKIIYKNFTSTQDINQNSLSSSVSLSSSPSYSMVSTSSSSLSSSSSSSSSSCSLASSFSPSSSSSSLTPSLTPSSSSSSLAPSSSSYALTSSSSLSLFPRKIKSFYNSKKVRYSYGIILYSISTQRFLLVKHKVSSYFYYLLGINFKKDELSDLLSKITYQEYNDLTDMILNKKLLSKYEFIYKFQDYKNLNFQTLLNYYDDEMITTILLFDKKEKDNLRWTFPKGKKNYYREPQYICSIRELKEETGIDLSQYRKWDRGWEKKREEKVEILKNLNPVRETYSGFRGKVYNCKYWIHILSDEIEAFIPEISKNEIKIVQWVSYDEAIKNMSMDKIKILDHIRKLS